MRYIVFLLMIFCILATAESAHMIKDNEHKGRQDYPDNRRAGYEFLGWGMYGSGPMGYGIAPGMTGYDGCGMMGNRGMMGYGGPGMMGYGMGPGMWGYDADRFDTYLNDTVDLRRELINRQFDYSEALRNRDMRSDDLIKMETEMLELQLKIKEKCWNRTDDKDNEFE